MLLESKRDGVRIEPLGPPDPPDVGELLAGMMPPGVPPIGLFRTFVRNVPMTRAMLGWGRYELSRDLSLGLRQREIVIDRTCARCGCEYEWGVHVARFADRAQLTSAQVASLVHGSSADPCWDDELDRLLIEAVDELHDHARIGDELWALLAHRFDDAQLLDVLMLSGWYHAISYVANSAGVAHEPDTPRFGDVA